MKRSTRSRHELRSIGAKSYVEPKNSVALPGIDTPAEIGLIQEGYGERLGNNRYRVNGRIYAHKPDGTMYPESGDGIVQVTRLEFISLRMLIKFNGHTREFIEATRRDPLMSGSVIEVALRLYELREGV